MRALGTLLLLGGLSGCGTVVNLWLGVDEDWAKVGSPKQRFAEMDTQIYGGLQNDVHGIVSSVEGEAGSTPEWNVLGFLFFAFIDFPLSLAADTVTLVYTVPYVLTRSDPRPSSPQPDSLK